MEITQSEKQKWKIKKREESTGKLYDTIKSNNICIMGIPEEEKIEKGTESIFKAIIYENS